jgi:diaminopimelate epimerase
MTKVSLGRRHNSLFGLPFSKLVATGNDFVFVDARMNSEDLDSIFNNYKRSDLARIVCDRHYGIGADGLVFVELLSDGTSLSWDFYNSDGSIAEMCGNATRCMGRWAEKYLGSIEIHFKTLAGTVNTKIDGRDICTHLPFVNASMQLISGQGAALPAYLINTGVPHVVFEVADISEPRRYMAEILTFRFHPEVGKNGANVTLVQIHGATQFSTVTFERGVEGFTLSCGTGVMAAAAFGLSRSQGSSAKLSTPGGNLEVFYGENRQGVILKGAATLVYEGLFSEENLK